MLKNTLPTPEIYLSDKSGEKNRLIRWNIYNQFAKEP